MGTATTTRGTSTTTTDLTFTDRAREILARSDAAARRTNPDARVRLAAAAGGLEAQLTDVADPSDVELEVNGARILVADGLAGVVDIEEPHDRIVLRPS